jgi:isopentenyl phosphate kinase
MYKNKSSYVYSASDLILHMNSPFASWMARFALDKPGLVEGIEKDQDEMMGLLAIQL